MMTASEEPIDLGGSTGEPDNQTVKSDPDPPPPTKVKVHKVSPYVDIHNRDPELINEHVRLTFSEVIAEPESSTYSFDKIFELSALVFTQTKLWIYRILSAILALPLMVLWGIYFACLSFATIWCCVPAQKAFEINFHCFRKIFNILLATIVEPFFIAVGKVFSGIHVTRE